MDIKNLKNSRVLVRVNYDIPTLESIDRIFDSKKTINILLKNNNCVILLSHWGRPDGNNIELSLQKLVPVIESILNKNIIFYNQYNNGFGSLKNKIERDNSEIYLLENTRFEEGEKSIEPSVRKKIASRYAQLADYFVDEAFAVSHRNEATNTEIKDILDWDYGLSYKEEIVNLDRFKNSNKPISVIMGGAKLETKLDFVEKILHQCDQLFLGGQLCFPFVEAMSYIDKSTPKIHNSKYDMNFVHKAKKILQIYSNRIVLPVDFVYMKDFNQILAVDLGPATIEKYKNKLVGSKAVFWNGPVGYYEKKPYDFGTQEIARIITSLQNCYKVNGGGDTVSSIDKNILGKFDWVSMGGGATLDYLVK
ncbi:phosphoglycerate kinase [Candidatus Gracilibacteria bacterium]|nr:phosphoglycerate kinase [Candidatus Gracilibacteria bacterium]